MTEYIVLIPDNETKWAAKDEAERQAMYGKHREFAERRHLEHRLEVLEI